MLKSNPYMKAYLNIISESSSVEKYQQIAEEIGGVYIPETNTIDCKGNKVYFKNSWLDENGSFNFKLINTSNNWSYMFDDCDKLIYLLDNFTIPNGVIGCHRMFSNCKFLTHLPKNFTIPNSVIDCSYMFNWCISLIHLPENFTIPESVEDCSYMFYQCSNLTHLPENFHIPYNVTDYGMFAWCNKLKTIDPKAYMIWEM